VARGRAKTRADTAVASARVASQLSALAVTIQYLFIYGETRILNVASEGEKGIREPLGTPESPG